jgi:hypothetical protein
MTCDETKHELPGFHFGELSGVARSGVEAHLVTCLGCVSDLVALKRAIELAEEGPRPSDQARSALRAAVSAQLVPWRWWERPVAFFVAASSVVLAVVLVQH